MANEIERLIVRLEVSQAKFEKQMAAASRTADRQAKRIEGRFARMSKDVGGSFSFMARAFAGGFIGYQALRGIKNLSEATTRIDNALKVAGLSGKELNDTFDQLAASAQKNGAPLEAMVTLYSRASLVQKELGVTQQELIEFTDRVGVSLRVSGQSAEAARGALLQLGQALSTGVVRAEEYNSLQEGATPILRAVAAGLKEAGGSVGALTNLVKSGKVSSEAFFRAFEAGSPILDQMASKATFTLAQASENLQTALLKTAREFNNATGAGEKFAGSINTAADAINGFDVGGFIQALRDAKSEFDTFLADIGNSDVFLKLNQAMGVVDGDGFVINVDKEQAEAKTRALEKEVETLQERIALNTRLGFDNTEALARIAEIRSALAGLQAATPDMPDTFSGVGVVEGVGPVPDEYAYTPSGGPRRGGKRRATVEPVSLSDFAPPPGKKKSGGKSKVDDYQREIEQIKERTAAIQAETAAMAGLNPLVDDYGFAVEKANAVHDLLTAAQKAGLDVTPELRANIDQLATSYAQASVDAEKLAESQDRVRESAEFSRDVTQGFISDLLRGKSAADALAGALQKIADKLLNEVLDAIFQVNSAGGGGFGGLLGGLLGGFGPSPTLFSYDGGGFTGTGARTGGVDGKGGFPAVLHPNESIIDHTKLSRSAAGVMKGDGGGVSVAMPINIDATGADAAGLARVEAAVSRLRAELPGKIVSTMKDARIRRIPT
ncbi:hypothetical protein E2A64_10340 [Pseudohoeflea suaedae]|uniref:Tape measure protein N-terminal domain-containing protein n=1 Tax=Pseudohoeflea suaedae TaxID=877384 RepID=A0A4R5PJG4_9HYPH|nr:tape measure protein [Pseudohoeflea suaedae]TDH35726.1 hypothetical protein E2A64_10340 [Pseudohoeflea suaedae]